LSRMVMGEGGERTTGSHLWAFPWWGTSNRVGGRHSYKEFRCGRAKCIDFRGDCILKWFSNGNEEESGMQEDKSLLERAVGQVVSFWKASTIKERRWETLDRRHSECREVCQWWSMSSRSQWKDLEGWSQFCSVVWEQKSMTVKQLGLLVALGDELRSEAHAVIPPISG
jgi:hypothetical protein